jgi:hypothetical protein
MRPLEYGVADAVFCFREAVVRVPECGKAGGDAAGLPLERRNR